MSGNRGAFGPSGGTGGGGRRGSTQREPERLEPGWRSYHTTVEVADHFRCSARTVRDWIARGCPIEAGPVRLGAFKRGKDWLIPDDELWLFEHRVRPPRRRPDLDPDEPSGE